MEIIKHTNKLKHFISTIKNRSMPINGSYQKKMKQQQSQKKENRQPITFGYIRVSSDMQTVENQRYEISNWATSRGISIDKWIEETVSGGIDYNKRQLGILLKKIQPGDTLICSELSRLGRNLFMVMEILSGLMNKDVKVLTIKDGYTLGDNIQSKVLAFAFSLAAEIERDMLRKRTTEALRLRRAQGIVLGRPLGVCSKKTKLSGKENIIQEMLDNDIEISKIAKIFHCHRNTVAYFIKKNGLRYNPKLPVFTNESSLRNKVVEINEMLKKGMTQAEIKKACKNTGFSSFFTKNRALFISDEEITEAKRQRNIREFKRS